MKRRILISALILSAFLIFGYAPQVRAGTIFLRVAVEANVPDERVSGMVATYVSYDLYEYYDPAAFGILVYANPFEQIDQDGGIGVNDFLYGYYPGYKAVFTTNDYRSNKVLCTLGEHALQAVYNPIPFQWLDPYGIGSMAPMQIQGDYDLLLPNSFTSESYVSGDGYMVVAYSQVCVQTPTVESVTFETVNSAVTNDNPESLGGGQRIFPDRQTLTPNEPNRRIVRVKAQLAPSGGDPTFEPGVRVYFRNFDVDDPSSDSIIDSNGSSGNDNRWLSGTPQSAGALSNCTAYMTNGCYATTNSQGIATADFTVTMQPGDNFRIAASTDQTYLNGLSISGTGLRDSTNNLLPTTMAKQTPLLTVWRKVHIEVDSMTTVGNNVTNGYIRSKKTVGSTAQWVNVLPHTGPLEPGRFENGRMRVGLNNLEVVDNTDVALLVRSTSGNVTLTINSLFQLFDDDDFNDDDGPPPSGDGILDGDDGEDVTFRDPSNMNDMFFETFSRLQPSSDISLNPFAAAYVEPNYSWAQGQTGMNDPNTPFRERIDVTPNLYPVERPIVNENRDSEGAEFDDFWMAYILIGYQSGYFSAVGSQVGGDPLGAGVAGGVSPTPTDALVDLDDVATQASDVKSGSIGSIIYIESMRDFDLSILSNPNPPPGIVPDFRTKTVPHELGHQFGLRGDVPGFGLMSPNETQQLVPQHINIVRWRLSSPGKPF